MSWLLWIGLTIVVGIILIAMLPKPKPLSASDVARHIRDMLNDSGAEWDWDHFEHARIVDAELKRIRRAAIMAGPPDVNRAALETLLRDAEALAQGEAATHSEPS